jgi:hypothetical protein
VEVIELQASASLSLVEIRADQAAVEKKNISSPIRT